MRESIQDKIVKHVAECGEEGVSSLDLARKFLAPASAPEALCERLIANVLQGEGRVRRAASGAWVALRLGAPDATGEFAVVEACDLPVGAGKVPIEWAVIRMDAAGKVLRSKDGVIRLDVWPAGAVCPAHLRERRKDGRSLPDALADAAECAAGTTLVSVAPGPFQQQLAHTLEQRGAPAQQLFLGRLARQVFGQEVRTVHDLAGRLGVALCDPECAAERAAFAAELLAALLARKDALGLGDPAGWIERQAPPRADVDFSRFDFDRAFLDALPERPGVYVMRDGNGEPLYVGKALNLRRRVNDYFRARVRTDEKTQRLLDALYAIEVTETGSELAALLEEFRLIRELQPPVNVQEAVHDRPAAQRAPSRRWIVVLPAPGPEDAEVFLFYGDRALRRAVVPRADPERLRPVVAEFFFADQPPERASESEMDGLRIAWSWLERHRDAANAFDVEMAGGLEDALRLVARYMAEAGGPDRVFHV